MYGELAVIDECDYNACQRLAFTGGRWSDRQDLAGDCTPAHPSAEKRLCVDTVWRMHRRIDPSSDMPFSWDCWLGYWCRRWCESICSGLQLAPGADAVIFGAQVKQLGIIGAGGGYI